MRLSVTFAATRVRSIYGIATRALSAAHAVHRCLATATGAIASTLAAPPPPPLGRRTPPRRDPRDVPLATLTRLRGMFYDSRVRLSRRQQQVFSRPADAPLVSPLADHGYLYGLREADLRGASASVLRALSTRTANHASARSFRNASVVRQHEARGASPFDTGSSRVKVTMLTARLTQLALHASKNGHDMAVKRRLQVLSSRRRKLLQYMMRSDYANYRLVVSELALRSIPIVGSRHVPKVRAESHKKVNARSATKRKGGTRGHLGH